MRLIAVGRHHVNPDHVMAVIKEDDGRIRVYLSNGDWIDGGNGEVSAVLTALVGGGQPV